MDHISKDFGYYKAQNALMARPIRLDTFAPVKDASADPLYPESGKRLRLLRLAIHEMDNQRAFAELYGFGHTNWNNYEKGKSRPGPDEALRIKQKFHVTTDWIYDGTEMLMPGYLLEKMAGIAASETGSPRKTRRAKTKVPA